MKTKFSTIIKIILFCNLIFAIFYSCTENGSGNVITGETTYSTIIIDSCEYLRRYEGYESGYSFTHKGNCKNSISMLAQSLFSHNELENLTGSEKQDKMMKEKGTNWNNLETKYKRGVYVKRIKTSKPFNANELASLPPMHKAHKNPNLCIERSIIKEIEYPIFSKIENKVEVIFFDAEPKQNLD